MEYMECAGLPRHESPKSPIERHGMSRSHGSAELTLVPSQCKLEQGLLWLSDKRAVRHTEGSKKALGLAILAILSYACLMPVQPISLGENFDLCGKGLAAGTKLVIAILSCVVPVLGELFGHWSIALPPRDVLKKHSPRNKPKAVQPLQSLVCTMAGARGWGALPSFDTCACTPVLL